MASNAVDPSTSVFTDSLPRWLASISLQLPSWTDWLPTAEFTHKVKVTLRLTVGQSVSQSVSLGVEDMYYSLIVTVLFLWGALSDERMRLSFVYATGPCRRSLSRVRVPWISRPYFTVSVLRLPLSSPPTNSQRTIDSLCSLGTDHGKHLSKQFF
jgi:hypothetical protein